MSADENLEARIEAAIKNPRNLGEMENADAVGTVGSPDCGDMLRMWIKFKEENGRRIIDRASFQSFGCQTAIAVASVATELLAGKTIEEARTMSGEELAAPLGALPPVRIHCAQLVEGALRSALSADQTVVPSGASANTTAPTLFDQLSANTKAKVKIVMATDKHG
ncbi:MAG: iron-sulfur cluster assembly scaffold protein [Chthoniobacterales bacterium]|nr:iron-sulfur cluster assembly scaffold protein [Chthoniobacterales bacterium]MDQ3119135.1 iron-sulfur cluster assembly scaffold protein [Verrucomicrobiota bacterium]